MNKKTAMSERTKQDLKNAFLELYANKGRLNITVSELTKKAGCNRSTFYNYYDDLNGMLDEIENSVIEQVQINLQNVFSGGIPNDMSVTFPFILSVFEEYGNTLYILFGENGDEAFRQRLRKIVKNFFREIFKNRVSAEKLEYILTFITSAGLGLIEHWYETDKQYSTEDFLKLSHELITSGLFGTILETEQKILI
ncbi:MAG: TetR/AcrR family transcriptional regulator [Clostridiales bacterium]|nr:TetR/AcrR family transcriptional regulator [Clostridiales bacterium]